MTNVYLAGPVTGIGEGWEKPFRNTAAALRDAGYTVFDPSETEFNVTVVPSGRPSKDLRAIFTEEFMWLIQKADHIYMLPGWENSKGAQAEWAIARALGLRITYGEPTD